MIAIACVVIAGSTVIYWASLNTGHGNNWADRVCHEVALLCNEPHWLLAAVVAVIAGVLVRQMMKS
jgi:hypothetical protein